MKNRYYFQMMKSQTNRKHSRHPAFSQDLWTRKTIFESDEHRSTSITHGTTIMPLQNSIIQLFQPLALASIVAFLSMATFVQPTLANPELSHEPIVVTLKDFQVHPSTTQANSGWLTFKAVNDGNNIHELVILQTDMNPAKLPRKEAKNLEGIATEYLVNEEDARIKIIDEIKEFPSGTSQEKKIHLKPGQYVLFCNIPGHYDKGMYSSLLILPE